MTSKPDIKNINLQLGDIIEIKAPTDDNTNNKRYFINYIDSNKVKLLDNEGNKEILYIDNGKLRNESIISIIILSHSSVNGYARQNELLPGKWIDVYFNDDIPFIITGKITNLEEDQIEITIYESKDIIYIDFGYKGLPEDIPIEKIIIRGVSPEKTDKSDIDINEVVVSSDKESEESQKQHEESDEGEIDEVVNDEGDSDEGDSDEGESEEKQKFEKLIFDADQIEFGEELDPIIYEIDVPESEKRYSIEVQTNDLLNDLLSRIPNINRTQNILNNIHRMIERYKQLRTEFSDFNEQNYALKPKIQGANYKPLINVIKDLSKKLYWILPVCTTIKKVYDADMNIVDEFSDIENKDMATDLNEITELINSYVNNSVSVDENRYIHFMKSLKVQMQPYNNDYNDEKLLISQVVNDNILSVIDNDDDFNSSVIKPLSTANMSLLRIVSKRFNTQNYNLGDNMLKSSEIKGDHSTSVVKMTENDTICVRSFLTLPEPILRFSHVNLPATDIMTKVNLNMNYVDYWKLLQDNTPITTINVDNEDKPLELDEKTYLKNIVQYLPNVSCKDDYSQYLDKMIPKTRVLFNLIKSYIKGKLSVYEILKYLEPFMIYQKDISFKQYEEFNNFINKKIQEFKKNYIQKSKEYSILDKVINKNKYKPYIFKLLGTQEILANIVEYYRLDKIQYLKLSNSELLNYFKKIDNLQYYYLTISLINIKLLTNGDIENYNSIEKWMNDKNVLLNSKESECNIYVLAKKYYDIDELEEDNGKEVIFDKQYDKTYYDIIDEYEHLLDRKTMSNDEMITIISENLQQNNGLNTKDAYRDAKAMLLGYKIVEDNDYAVIVLESEVELQYLYYKRSDNIWVKDDSIPENTNIDDNKLFCNINDKCLKIKDKCEDQEMSKHKLTNKGIKQFMDEFDTSLFKNREKVIEIINKELKITNSRITSIINLNKLISYKYNNLNYNLGFEALDIDTIESPYMELMETILGQGDFIKRQSDIIKFINLYTRPALESEDLWWYYCNKTGAKLLPIFMGRLANSFNKQEDYLLEIQKICAEQGTISDDGELWVDKHTGYTITKIDFDTAEGFSVDGYKITSRNIMEEDIGDNIINSSNTVKNKFTDPNGEKIYNVATALANYSGVDISPHIEYIVRSSLKILTASIPSKEKYQLQVEKNMSSKSKDLDSYETIVNQSLIIITLVYYLISVVTSIPSIVTRKRHPGCVRSFTGYPLTGIEDISGLTYVACIANQIKGSVEPWNSISKLNEKKLIDRMKHTISKLISTQEDIKTKIAQKLNYNKLNIVEDIPEEHIISNWINFLPPLSIVKVKEIETITDIFKQEFNNDIKTGSDNIIEKISTMKSKIINYSLKIQELIQEIVKTQQAILMNSNSDAFLENACCDNGNKNTYQYFVEQDSIIEDCNINAQLISKLLFDINHMSKARILCSSINIKQSIPDVLNDYSEETIYKTFIIFCNYNSNIPISEELRSICIDKPENYNKNDNIKDKISKLKQNGINYTREMFNQLININSKNNIININIYNIIISNIQKLKDIFDSINDRETNILPQKFINDILGIIENFEINNLMEDTPEMRSMKNYLHTTNEILKNELIDFIIRNTTNKNSKDIIDCIINICNFQECGDNIYIEKEDETILKTIDFIKKTIHLIISVLPNIIINKVSYNQFNAASDIHWDISYIHKMDLSNILNKYYTPLYKLYDDTNISFMLSKIQTILQDFNIIIKNTIFHIPINVDEDKYLYSVFDRRMILMLFKFYFYSILKFYIQISDDEEIVIGSLQERTKLEMSPSVLEIEEDNQGVIPDIEIITGEKKLMGEKIGDLLSVYGNIIYNEKSNIDYNYETFMEKVLRSREKEKDVITDYLRSLSEEEREIENLFKNHKLEKWSKGLQKGVRIYQSDTYDDERKEMEKQILIENKLGKTDVVSEMNKNIYAMDEMINQENEARIEQEENDLSNYYGENDDDMPEDYDGDEQY